MNIAQIIEVLPLQVYLRRGELVIHFSNPADLVNRLAETSVALAELDGTRADGKADRVGRRALCRPLVAAAGRPEVEPGNDADQPAVG
jgi:hypothetical protein